MTTAFASLFFPFSPPLVWAFSSPQSVAVVIALLSSLISHTVAPPRAPCKFFLSPLPPSPSPPPLCRQTSLARIPPPQVPQGLGPNEFSLPFGPNRMLGHIILHRHGRRSAHPVYRTEQDGIVQSVAEAGCPTVHPAGSIPLEQLRNGRKRGHRRQHARPHVGSTLRQKLNVRGTRP